MVLEWDLDDFYPTEATVWKKLVEGKADDEPIFLRYVGTCIPKGPAHQAGGGQEAESGLLRLILEFDSDFPRQFQSPRDRCQYFLFELY